MWWVGARERDQGVLARVRLRNGVGRRGAPGQAQGSRDQSNCIKNMFHAPRPFLPALSGERHECPTALGKQAGALLPRDDQALPIPVQSLASTTLMDFLPLNDKEKVTGSIRSQVVNTRRKVDDDCGRSNRARRLR